VWAVEVEQKPPPTEASVKLVQLTVEQSSRLTQWHAIVTEWTEENALRDAAGDALRAGGWCGQQWTARTGREWPPKGSKIPRLTAVQEASNVDRRRLVAQSQRAERERARDIVDVEEWSL